MYKLSLKVAVQIYILPSSMCEYLFLQPHQHLKQSDILIFAQWGGVKLPLSLICISLFMRLSILIFWPFVLSSVDCLFISFAHLLVVFVFFVVCLKCMFISQGSISTDILISSAFFPCFTHCVCVCICVCVYARARERSFWPLFLDMLSFYFLNLLCNLTHGICYSRCLYFHIWKFYEISQELQAHSMFFSLIQQDRSLQKAVLFYASFYKTKKIGG